METPGACPSATLAAKFMRLIAAVALNQVSAISG